MRGLAARRQKMGVPKLSSNDLPGGLHLPPVPGAVGGGPSGAGLGGGRPLIDEDGHLGGARRSFGTPFANFSKIVYVFVSFHSPIFDCLALPGVNCAAIVLSGPVLTLVCMTFWHISDPSGALNFSGKAVLHASGVDFSNGSSFAINMGQLQLDEELGKGNYGTVKKVLHKPTNVAMAMKVSRKKIPHLANCFIRTFLNLISDFLLLVHSHLMRFFCHCGSIQEIRLELDEAKLNGIIMELDILHRAVAPEIVEFYGAFFIESYVPQSVITDDLFPN